MRCVVCCGSTSFPWVVFFFGALLCRSMIHKHTGRWTWLYQPLDPSTLESIDPWIHRQFNLWTLGSIDTWIYRPMGPSSWFVLCVVDLLTLGSIDPWMYRTLDLSGWLQTGKSRALIKPEVSIKESQNSTKASLFSCRWQKSLVSLRDLMLEGREWTCRWWEYR